MFKITPNPPEDESKKLSELFRRVPQRPWYARNLKSKPV